MKRIALICFVLAAFGINAAEMRIWKAATGSSEIEAVFLATDGMAVTLKTSGGKEVTVPIDKLCEADQAYLAEKGEELAVEAQQDRAPDNLPYAMGKIVGPIEAGSDAHYLLYLPTTLRKGREAPLLFYTHAGGGDGKLLSVIKEGAELTGWVMAISMESKNNRDSGKNLKSSEDAVEHILETLPVAEDRLYFTGNSGGAAEAFRNCDHLDGCGVMPNIGYIPSGTSPPKGDAFIINGASDFNRYTSANARKRIGDTAVHRFHAAGHRRAPDWLMVDGMLWLEGRYLAREAKNEQEQLNEYVRTVLKLIGDLKKYEPYRAYYWALFLKEEMPLSGAQIKRVDDLVDELGQEQANRLFVEGLRALDELSEEYLADFGGGSTMNYLDSTLASDCEDLLKHYSGVPVIEETLREMMKETAALKGH